MEKDEKDIIIINLVNKVKYNIVVISKLDFKESIILVLKKYHKFKNKKKKIIYLIRENKVIKIYKYIYIYI
jgi:hypothetical protein